MIITDAAGIVGALHGRMPLMLHPGDYREWTDGAPDEIRELCERYQGNLQVERTDAFCMQR